MKIKGSLLMSTLIVIGFGGKIWLGHVTCKHVVAEDPILESPTPMTIQLSWSYDED